ncbi:unnamed protein product [Haemonchus placei]|uniref:7TM_GPCR_Srx domain-containing protein n=1 Tax=Haemonchus placei TaxID=6290 RepID=A0A0N4WRA7_HAEPC|nr:unnamed protein product [Haemonchus placei]
MSNTVPVFVLNFALSTMIIAMDLLIIFIGIRTKEIRRLLVLHIIFFSMGMDILAYVNEAVHDVPSYDLDKDIFEGQFIRGIISSWLIGIIAWMPGSFEAA